MKAAEDEELVAAYRSHSCLDKHVCSCFSTRCRNLFMFIAIGASFFVLPVMLMIVAFATQFND